MTPTAAHAGRFVILQEPLAAGPEGDPANGAIGRALLHSGLSVARIEVAADADAFAAIKAGDATQLRSGSSGAAQVLWKETTGATRWAIVRLGLATASAGPVLIFDQWIHWDTHQAKVYLSEDGTAAKAQDLRGHCIALSAAYRFRSDVAGAQTEACWPAYSALVHYQLGPNWSGATDARFWQSSGGTGLGYVYGYIEAGTGKVYLQSDKYPEGGGYTNTDIQMRVVVWRYRALLEPGIYSPRATASGSASGGTLSAAGPVTPAASPESRRSSTSTSTPAGRSWCCPTWTTACSPSRRSCARWPAASADRQARRRLSPAPPAGLRWPAHGRVNLTLGALFRVAGDRGSGALFSWRLGFGL